MITNAYKNQLCESGSTAVKQQDYSPEDFTSSACIMPRIMVDYETMFPLQGSYVHYIGGMDKLYSTPQTIYQQSRSGNLSNELNSLYDECSMPNWDGYGAKPVYKSIRKTVEKFLDALPPNIEDPEIGADPDGEISLDWCNARNKMFAISIGRKNRIAYAILDGDIRSNGIEIFKGNLPPIIIYHFEKFFGNQV